MSLPGFSAELALLKPARPYKAEAHQTDQAGPRALVIPQIGIGRYWWVFQTCRDDGCVTLICNEAGCRPAGFTLF